MGWFGIVAMLHVLGLYLFTNGFLLTRMVLTDRSECAVAPIEGAMGGSIANGCWHPKSFEKVVLVVIDALRYDFVVPFQEREGMQTRKHYHDSFRVLYETAERSPGNAVLLPFIADPPTTTLQRLKGLTTGTLPTFIDAGSNFAGTAIDEDNLVEQATRAGKTVVHLGDDTWHALFPGHFDMNLTKAYDSFNVWDLHTVDNGVIEHLGPLLAKENRTRWDVLIGHALGVDHAGHRYGPDHPAMTAKLEQMDAWIRKVMDAIDDMTLLVVMGDHGMDSKGDHGGESDDEIQAALWMYSKKSIFGRRPGHPSTPLVATDRPVAQIDIVPTLALLLGLPIPFNNLGAPIYEAFSETSGSNYRNLAAVARLTAAQIARYMKRYTSARKIEVSKPTEMWELAELLIQDSKKAADFQAIFSAYSAYQIEVLSICRDLWARFNVPSMIAGITILAVALGILLAYASVKDDVTDISPRLVKSSLTGAILGLVLGLFSWTLFTDSLLSLVAFTTSSGIALGSTLALVRLKSRIQIPLPTTWPTWLSVVFTIGLSGSFASNSYTIWEDRNVLFLLGTIATLLFASSLRQDKVADRVTGCYYSALFIGLSRLASFSRLCREEQMPYCLSTYYGSSTSSTSALWHLAVPLTVAIALPGMIIQFYQATHSYHHSAKFWYGFVFRSSLWLSAAYWILNTADDNDWYSISSLTWLQGAKVTIARISLGLSLVVGYTIYTYSAPYLGISTAPLTTTSTDQTTNQPGIFSRDRASRLSVLGYANVHGTRYLPLLTLWSSSLILLQKPLGSGTTALHLLQILSLLESLNATNLAHTPLAPTTLVLLGQLHFFSTGHQASLSSIQWDTAFIPLRSMQMTYSALLIILNTLGAPFLSVLAIPLLALWRAPARKRALMSDVARSAAYAVAVHAVIALATAVWAMHLRRHLMLFRVFCPRFLLAGVTLLGVDGVVVFGSILGVRWSFLSVNEIIDATA